ncbi:MAG: NifB/NifX family molybdenum-iron cluster-binding protein [Thermodesulfobacteriota bacterium]
MKKIKLAVPTNSPGGMKASRSDHFGHCDLFTVIDLHEGKVISVETVENAAHEAGGCMVPVRLLQERDVDALVVGGMGARPLMGFNEVGIDVYFAERDEFRDVEAVVSGFLQGRFPVMQPQHTCQGGGDCHH